MIYLNLNEVPIQFTLTLLTIFPTNQANNVQQCQWSTAKKTNMFRMYSFLSRVQTKKLAGKHLQRHRQQIRAPVVLEADKSSVWRGLHWIPWIAFPQCFRWFCGWSLSFGLFLGPWAQERAFAESQTSQSHRIPSKQNWEGTGTEHAKVAKLSYTYIYIYMSLRH